MPTHKHTPGPWTIDKLGSITTYDKDLGWTVRLADIPDHDDEEQAANARLIAAAPDLLAALTRLVSICEDVEPEAFGLTSRGRNCMLMEARAAIAKATGENL